MKKTIIYTILYIIIASLLFAILIKVDRNGKQIANISDNWQLDVMCAE